MASKLGLLGSWLVVCMKKLIVKKVNTSVLREL